MIRWEKKVIAASKLLVEVNLLRLIRLMIDRLHVLRMHSGVGVVEHLLHRWQHRGVDVARRRNHHFVVVAVLLAHHPVRLLNNRSRVLDGLVVGVVLGEAVGGVGGTAGGGNGAGVNVGVDDRLIMLLMMGLVMITCKRSFVLANFRPVAVRTTAPVNGKE